MLREGDEGSVGAEDSSLFAGDFCDGVAKVVLMIERDVGDDGEDRVDDVGGVETASEAYFEDGDVEVLLGEVEEGEGGEGFEEAGMVRELAGGDEGLGGVVDTEVEAGEGVFGNFVEARAGCWVLGVGGQRRNTEILSQNRLRMMAGLLRARAGLGGVGDADAFGDAGEVGRGVEASAIAGGSEDGGKRGSGAALAVGAGDEDCGELFLRIAQRGGKDAHVSEVEFAARHRWGKLQTERLKTVDRRCVRHRGILERIGRGGGRRKANTEVLAAPE